MKTMLAVDSLSIRRVLKEVLGGVGCGAAVAGDGNVGIEAARSRATHMVVADLDMPGTDWIRFIRALRQTPPCRGAPIDMRATESDDGLKQQAKAAGATSWRAKPFRQDQLIDVNEKLLG